MYLLIYSENPSSFNSEYDFINWRYEKNLEKVYKFMDKNKKYQFHDCCKVSKKINLDLLKKYKNRIKKG